TLGWIAWCAGDETTAVAEAKVALEVWTEGVPYPFKWMALWPLIAIAIECKDVSAAAKYSQQLLDPPQQPLPPELAACVAEIINAHNSAQEKRGWRLLVTRFSSRANLNTFEFTVILVVGATGFTRNGNLPAPCVCWQTFSRHGPIDF